MATYRTPVQFRLDEGLYSILKSEAEARALTPNEYAKKLMNQALLSDVNATERNSTNIKLNATSTFTLLAVVPLLIRLVRPEISVDEALQMAEKEVFSMSRQRADSLMRNLGVEE